MNQDDKKTAPRGRPVKNTMPEPIPDTAENIARGDHAGAAQGGMELHEGGEGTRI